MKKYILLVLILGKCVYMFIISSPGQSHRNIVKGNIILYNHRKYQPHSQR